MSLSESIRFAVLSSGLSQRQIEEETGLGRGVLARFLSKERDIQLSTADRLADYFGLALVPAEATKDVMLQVVTEVRESAEKARASALSAVEELDALRHRFINRGWHLTPIEGVTHDLPKSLISQPRKKGRPKKSD